MASSKEYLDFILEQLSGLEGITFKPMMGEYILYMYDRIFGGIYDDRFLVKPTKSAVAMMPDTDRELPYEGAKGRRHLFDRCLSFLFQKKNHALRKGRKVF